jgi:hypothetical protein
MRKHLGPFLLPALLGAFAILAVLSITASYLTGSSPTHAESDAPATRPLRLFQGPWQAGVFG